MSVDIATLISKLRNAPQKVGTFGRGDPDPVDEFAPLMTGAERDWLIVKLRTIDALEREIERLNSAASVEINQR